ncbi:uncharacterized protein LOC123530804 [Mercenaria mercenaria]|uniref:uncharacterized protein LOC123530804 n=1 Tax=Mercenaria mercenaria TaxID=6596 RepID=UPI00234FACF6|nr:uncharacterized protein LOC123530804 [Mercenaria mercenaria]
MGRKQKIHDQQVINKAIAEIDKGKSVYSISKKYEIPETTLRNHARGKYRGHKTSFGPKHLLNASEETTLVSYVLYMADRGFPLTRKVIKNLAKEVVQISQPGYTGPSKKWMKSFLKRNKNLTVRKSHALDKGRASITQTQIDQYFQVLKQTLERLDIANKPSHIYNCDETGFSGNLTSDKSVVVKKGVRQAFRAHISLNGHITVNFAINAAGQTVPPFIIFSKNLPRDIFKDGLPDNWEYECTESGFINGNLFSKWFSNVFLPALGNRRPCVLIMDNHTSHMSASVIKDAMENSVDLLYFPSHSSHLLQPLDVGYFHVLKSKLFELASGLGYVESRALPRHIFSKLLHHAMMKISPAVVAAAFSATGIYPFHSSVVKPLSAPLSSHKEDSSTDTCPPSSPSPSDNRASVSKQVNMLVRVGMVPESLAEIFVEPPPIKQSKRKTYHEARVIESVPPLKKQCISEFAGKKSSSSKPSHVIDSMRESSEEHFTDAICEVCLTSRPLFWVGCDECDAWLHYECLPNNEKIDVDLSILTKSKWLCLRCREE